MAAVAGDCLPDHRARVQKTDRASACLRRSDASIAGRARRPSAESTGLNLSAAKGFGRGLFARPEAQDAIWGLRQGHRQLWSRIKTGMTGAPRCAGGTQKRRMIRQPQIAAKPHQYRFGAAHPSPSLFNCRLVQNNTQEHGQSDHLTAVSLPGKITTRRSRAAIQLIDCPASSGEV